MPDRWPSGLVIDSHERRPMRLRPPPLARCLVTLLAFSAGTPASAVRAQAGPIATASQTMQTPAEASSYLAFTSPDTSMAWLEELASVSGTVVRVDTLFALSGGAGPAQTVIPVATVGLGPGPGATGRLDDRVRVLVIGSQHGDERTGYEVALRLARDLSIGVLRPLLESLEVTIVPVLNPEGMRARSRYDGQGLDPNRDHVRLASEVNRALWRLHAERKPHVLLDLHEMGPTPYEAQVGLPTHPNVDPRLVEFARFRLLPYVVRALSERNVRFHEYVAENPDPSDPNGVRDPAEIFFSYAPITANNARNAFSLAGTLALLVETASAQEIDDLASRVDRSYLTTVSFLEVIAGLADEVRDRTRPAPPDDLSFDSTLALSAVNVADPDHPLLNWLRWSNRGTAVPYTVEPWRPAVQIETALPLPAAYLVMPSGAPVVARLLDHGIRVERLLEPVRLPVRGYETPDSLVPVTDVTFPAGSWLVRSGQDRWRLLFTLIEPGSDDGWVRSPTDDSTQQAGNPAEAEREIPVYRFDGTVPSLPVVAVHADDPEVRGGTDGT